MSNREVRAVGHGLGAGIAVRERNGIAVLTLHRTKSPQVLALVTWVGDRADETKFLRPDEIEAMAEWLRAGSAKEAA